MIATEERRELYAHCKSAMCRGYGQEKVPGIVQTTAYSYRDNGGNINGVERSTNDLRFVNEDDRPCRVCTATRELSESPRPDYQNLSNHDPMGLVGGDVQPFDPRHVNTEADEKIAALEAKLDKLLATQEAAA